MATPVTLKKEQELKQIAEKTRMRQHLLPLSQTLGQKSQHGNYNVYRNPGDDFTEDYNPTDRQFVTFNPMANYTNYRQKRTTYVRHPLMNGPPKPRQRPQVVEKMPEGHPFDEYVVDPDNLYTFSGENNSLGVHFPCDIQIDGFVYKSVEHYYQACKLYSLAGSQYASQLRTIDNPLKAKTKANNILKALHTDPEKITEWKERNGYFMYRHACIHKFVQHENLRNQLLDTGNKILAQAYAGDSLFACGMNADQLKQWAQEKKGTVLKYPELGSADDFRYIPLTGKGKNMFGIVLMLVRKMIRAQMEREKSGSITVECLIPDLYSSMSVLNLAGDGKENGTGEKGTDEAASVAGGGGGESHAPVSSASATPGMKILKKGEAFQ